MRRQDGEDVCGRALAELLGEVARAALRGAPGVAEDDDFLTAEVLDKVLDRKMLEQALRKAGNMTEAQAIRSQMEILLQANRNSSENALQVAHLNSEGMQLEKQGDFQGAMMKYRMALELDPTAGGIRLNYGLSLCRLHWGFKS